MPLVPLSMFLSDWTPFISLLFVLPLIRAEKDYHRAALYIILFFIVLGTVAVVKDITNVPRPPNGLMQEDGPSFPSGHAALGFFPLGFFWALTKWPRRATLAVYGVIVAYSRLVLGVHYPGDVVAGALLGYVVPYLAIRNENKLLRAWRAATKRR